MTHQSALNRILKYRTNYEYFQPADVINFCNVKNLRVLPDIEKFIVYHIHNIQNVKITRVWRISSLSCSYGRYFIRKSNLTLFRRTLRRITHDLLNN